MEQNIGPKISLPNTTPLNGIAVYQQGFLLRKVSKFLIGSDEDSIVTVPVLFDAKTGKVLLDTIPESIRNDYITDHLDNSDEGEVTGDNR